MKHFVARSVGLSWAMLAAGIALGVAAAVLMITDPSSAQYLPWLPAVVLMAWGLISVIWYARNNRTAPAE